MVHTVIQTIGLFGGTFDPIHNAHLFLAQQVIQQLQLNNFVFIPAGTPPQKKHVTAAAHRFTMTQLAVSALHIPDCKITVSNEEIQRTGPSYTIDTLQYWRNQFPSASLILILGSDQLLALNSWFKWHSLLDFAHLYIVARPGFHFHQCPNEVKSWFSNRFASLASLKTEPFGHLYLDKQIISSLSATAIREQLKQANFQAIAHQVPPIVLNYILEHHLYQHSS